MIRVLFVCLGNICRSPTAEGVFRALVTDQGLADRIDVDSAGTGAWHVGEEPDARAQEALAKRGIDISAQRGRQVEDSDFDAFDYILAMDQDNLKNLIRLCPSDRLDRLALFLNHAPELGVEEVPDPYYSGGFDRVVGMIEAGSRGLLDHIKRNHFAA